MRAAAAAVTVASATVALATTTGVEAKPWFDAEKAKARAAAWGTKNGENPLTLMLKKRPSGSGSVSRLVQMMSSSKKERSLRAGAGAGAGGKDAKYEAELARKMKAIQKKNMQEKLRKIMTSASPSAMKSDRKLSSGASASGVAKKVDRKLSAADLAQFSRVDSGLIEAPYYKFNRGCVNERDNGYSTVTDHY